MFIDDMTTEAVQGFKFLVTWRRVRDPFWWSGFVYAGLDSTYEIAWIQLARRKEQVEISGRQSRLCDQAVPCHLN